ncbi:acetoacetate--CoA ligase [Pararhodobacter aggregans]|uniref:acetoacetate--CoA ligase n=1 Tax=Pararhodobacter aggregans TaxID=404875 RepID=UPI003A93E8CE
MTEARPILWAPTPERAEATRMADFIRWLKAERGLSFADYNALWRWSVGDLPGFWSALVEYAGLDIRGHTAVLGRREMPGAEWFPGARCSLAAQVLAHAATDPDAPALIGLSETFGRRELSWQALAAEVAAKAGGLRALGVGQGDRVVAILPNTLDSMVAFLAVTSLGAIWSQAAPDMGPTAVLDRFRQIEPKVLIAQDSYRLAGKPIDRRAQIEGIAAGLPTLAARLMVPGLNGLAPGWSDWRALAGAPAAPVPVPYDHPLWIVYSSGTTGNPKPIVHGHGGILVECAKSALHMDLHPGDRYCWLTSSGWIMWNTQFFALMNGAAVVLFDVAPGYPDLMALWRAAADERLTHLGAGAAFYQSCLKAGIEPKTLDLSALRHLGSTGSPLSPEGYDWIYSAVKSDLWLAPLSGGTDLCGAFVGGNPMLPVRAGEMQCRFLGNAVRAFDEAGNEVFDQVGELVCTEPLPAMPLYFWNDPGNRRYLDSYFDTYPGVWRHGDWIEITGDGGAVIYGRSDATINRHGLRLGSSEIYRVVEALDEIADSLVIDCEYLGRASFMPLFIVPAPGVALDEALMDRIRARIRAEVSPRFVPDLIEAIPEVPRTLSGKKLEVPVKKLFLGGDPARVVNRDSMANPDSFDWFIAWHGARGA